MSNNIVFQLSPIVDLKSFSGRADFSVKDGVLRAELKGGDDSYVIRFDLPAKIIAAGVNVKIKLSGWDSISYAAIGYSKLTGYKHIKAKNIRKNAWVSLGFTHQDIAWQLQNSMSHTPDTDIKDIRLFIKGKPSAEGACLEIAELSVLSESTDTDLDSSQLIPDSLQDALYGYLKKAFRNYMRHANEFMQTGQCPMPGEQVVEWGLSSSKPEALETVNTFRAAWHGQQPAISLLLQAQETGDIGPVFAAKTFIDNWLDNSFYTPDHDIKYTWYDHGTAERLLAFIMMWAKGVELKLDRRFMERLAEAIVTHARLLNSESFYAYDQPERYHNHAWFQDAALITVALAFPEHKDSSKWLDNAISRFDDQLDKLIVRDGGFAIFVENSIGYHHGVQRLAEFIGELVALSGKPSEIPVIAQELIAWSDFLRYPDGRAPAQGDTFRLPLRTGKDVRRGKPWSEPSCTVLPKAGYAVVKGNHDGKPWMLCMFATSLSKTHKHEDNLSITFWFDGVEWLIDPSFYSHEYEQEIPKYLRSAAAHNNLYIPNAAYSIEPGSTTLEVIFYDSDRFCISASHECYKDIIIKREVKGKLSNIEFEVNECFKKNTNTTLEYVELGFNLQENVCAYNSTAGVELLCKDSDYIINIDFELPSVINNNSVGLGFMEIADASKFIINCNGQPVTSWTLTSKNKRAEGFY